MSAFSHCLKGLAIVYYITVVAFENKVPMCLDDHSLTYCQENPLLKIWQLSRTAYKSVVDLQFQQFCKDPSIFLKNFFWQAKGYLVLCFNIHKNYLTTHIVRKFHKFLFGFIKLLLCLETRIIHQFIALFAVLLEMKFCFFRETFFRNLKIVD